MLWALAKTSLPRATWECMLKRAALLLGNAACYVLSSHAARVGTRSQRTYQDRTRLAG